MQLERLKEKYVYFRFLHLYFHYFHGLLDNKTHVTSYMFCMLRRRILYISYSEYGWSGNDGKKYRFKLLGKNLYVGNWVIDFEQKEF